jgi:DNA-binding NtrC family response regulator
MITAAEVREMIKEHEVDEGGNPDTLEEVKRRHIFKILSECKGNQTMAADRLGISRTHLWRILKKYQN